MPKGFFSPTVWTRQQAPPSLIPECNKCGLFRHCKSPKMPVSGKGRKRVLIVAEGPGKNEDDRGIQLCGNAGHELVRLLHKIGVNMRRDCWLTNAVICRPMDANGSNRAPTDNELSYCRPNLLGTIKELEPEVIIPLGKHATKSVIALAWKDGEVDDMGSWAGWCIPNTKFNCWITPTYHPSFLLHGKHDPVV
jgi:uracil-DNA glycosylase family 4